MKSMNLLACLILALCATTIHAQVPAESKTPSSDFPFPRLMGMNIGTPKNYDDPDYQRQLARLHVVVLGLPRGWTPKYGIDQVVRNLKTLSLGNNADPWERVSRMEKS